MRQIEQYIRELLEKSTVECPVWNIEKAGKAQKSDWNYIDGCMIKALLEFGNISGKKDFLKFADAFIDYRVHEDGTISGYDINKLNLDDVNAGKTLFELYRITGKEKYRLAIDTIYEQIKRQPRTKEGNFWHKKIYPNQIWLDGFYMVQPFYMEYETNFNDRKNYRDIFQQFFNVYELMRDKNTGLYYHGYDSSREIFWCDKTTGLSGNFWLRAIGWFTMALLDTMSQCDPKGFEDEYNRMQNMFRELIDALIRYQSPFGMWYQVVNLAGQEPNYPETSGTAILSYAILKGVRLGFLPKDYAQYGKKAFQGICNTYLDTTKGEMNLGGICLVAGLGPDNNKRRDGTFEYYMSEPIVQNDAKGVGPFLLAYSELLQSEQV